MRLLSILALAVGAAAVAIPDGTPTTKIADVTVRDNDGAAAAGGSTLPLLPIPFPLFNSYDGWCSVHVLWYEECFPYDGVQNFLVYSKWTKPDGSIIPYKPEPTKWHLPGHFLDREDKGAWPLSGVLFSPFTARQYDLPDPYLTFEYQNCWWSTKDPSPQCGYCTVGDWTEGWDVKHCSKSKNPFDKRNRDMDCHFKCKDPWVPS